MTDNNLSNPEAEQALLGSILINPDIFYEVSPLIKSKDFYINTNSFVWDAMCAVVADKQTIDIVTVSDKLSRHGKSGDVSQAYLMNLLSQSPNSYNAPSYVGTITDLSARRDMVSALSKAAQVIYDVSKDIDVVLGEIPKLISDVVSAQNVGANDGSQDSDEASLDLLNDINNDTPTGIKTGFPIFDHVDEGLGGLPKKAASILVADSSLGKTALVLQICEQVAMAGGTALYFGYESPNKSMVSRRVFGSTKIQYKKLRSGSLTEDEKDTLREEIRDNYQGRFSKNGGKLIFNREAMSLAKIKRAIRNNQPEDENADYIVVIDQFKFITDRHQSGNITISFNDNFQQLKTYAEQYNCHILAVHGISAEESDKFFDANAKTGGKKENKLPSVNQISWAKDLKYLVDVFLFMIPEVSTQILAVGANRPTNYKMLVWILKDRDGDRFKDTYWDYDLVSQWWTDEYSPNKQRTAQRPTAAVKAAPKPVVRQTAQVAPPEPDEELFAIDVDDEFFVDED